MFQPQRYPVVHTFPSQVCEHRVPNQAKRKNDRVGGRGYVAKIECKRHYWSVSEQKDEDEVKRSDEQDDIQGNWTKSGIISVS